MRGHGTLIALVVATLAAAAAAPAQAQTRSPDGPPVPPYTTDSFAFAEPQVRDVRLTVPEGEGTAGTVTVRLNNRTRLAGRLRLRYFPYTGGPARVLLGPGQRRDGASARVVGTTSEWLGMRDYAHVRLRFSLPHGRPLQQLDGLVVAQLRARGRYGPVARLRVRGAAPRVTFDPPKVAFGIERYVSHDAGTAGEVIVRGADAAILARDDRPIGTQVLGSGAAQIRVDVQAPKLSDDGVYRSAVEVSDVAGLDAGEFAGTVPLTDGRDGPHLEVEARIGFSFLVMAAVVFLGAMVAGLGRRYTTASRDARILRMKLRAAVCQYDAAADERVCSHRLDGWLKPRAHGRIVARYPGTRGEAGMLWHLRTARTRKDVDEQRFRVRETIRAIERFLVLEPVARTAADLLMEQAPSGRAGDTAAVRHGWLYRETARLLDDAHVAPDPARRPAADEAAWKTREDADDAAAAALVSGLAERALMLDLALGAWTYLLAYDRVPELDPDVADAVAATLPVTLAALTAERPPADDRQELRLTLQRQLLTLWQLWPEDQPRPTRPARERDTRELAGLSADPGSAIAMTEPPKLRRDWGAIVQVDWAWTVVTGLIFAVGYTIGAEAFTDGTWGGDVVDYASAFVVGTAGEAVPWTRLPGYVGLDGRGEEPEPPSAGAPKEDAPAEAQVVAV